jgi:Fe2+ or Zn2+ uptake regulation protein
MAGQTAEKNPSFDGSSGLMEAGQGERRESVKKRETYRETILAIMRESRELSRKTLVEKAMARNPTISKRPAWVYRNVIRGLKKEGLLAEPERGKIVYVPPKEKQGAGAK